MEVEMTLERGRLIVDRINDHGTCSELAAAAHTPAQRVHDAVAAERLAPLGTVKREPREPPPRERGQDPTRSRNGAPACETELIARRSRQPPDRPKPKSGSRSTPMAVSAPAPRVCSAIDTAPVLNVDGSRSERALFRIARSQSPGRRRLLSS